MVIVIIIVKIIIVVVLILVMEGIGVVIVFILLSLVLVLLRCVRWWLLALELLLTASLTVWMSYVSMAESRLDTFAS